MPFHLPRSLSKCFLMVRKRRREWPTSSSMIFNQFYFSSHSSHPEPLDVLFILLAHESAYLLEITRDPSRFLRNLAMHLDLVQLHLQLNKQGANYEHSIPLCYLREEPFLSHFKMHMLHADAWNEKWVFCEHNLILYDKQMGHRHLDLISKTRRRYLSGDK